MQRRLAHPARLLAATLLCVALATCGADDTNDSAAPPPARPNPTPDAPASTPAAAPTYYQTKTPYRPQQDASRYEAPPAGYAPVYTEMLARHGSRGLSGFKYDGAIYDMLQRRAPKARSRRSAGN